MIKLLLSFVAMLTDDGMGVDALAAACCLVEDPALECEPKVKWDTITTCDKRCRFKIKEGLVYTKGNNQGMVKTYERIGFTKEGAVPNLLINFQGTLGEESSGYYFDEILRKELAAEKESTKFMKSCAGKKVQQFVLNCGFYEMRSKITKC